jgi:penicillin-binding protein 1B
LGAKGAICCCDFLGRLILRAVKKKVLVFLTFCLVICAGLFVWMDRRVAARLATPFSASLTAPTILTAPLNIGSMANGHRSGETLAQFGPLLINELSARQYIPVERHPVESGEYMVAGDSLSLITRSFTGADGRRVVGRAGRVNLRSGKLVPDDPEQPLQLEPQVIAYLGEADRRASTFVPLSEFPEHVKNAVIATEDERFYRHFGIDLIGIARAMVRNIAAGRLAEGGSTLTQQLAKNTILNNERTLKRKVLELFAAISLELRLSKDRILELYLNEVYLGQSGAVAVHGLPAAAIHFFGKDIRAITPNEAAVLAGTIRAPSFNNPRRHPQRARTRRDTVLTKMNELHFLDKSAYEAAVKSKIVLAKETASQRLAPHFAAAIDNAIRTQLGSGDAPLPALSIHTGLDPKMQVCATEAVETGLAQIEKRFPRLKRRSKRPLEAALVAIEPHTGLIKAWVGGRDFGASQFDRVSQTARQIGSTIKPFLYLTALDPGLNSYKAATPVSILDDRPITVRMQKLGFWTPKNFDHTFRGDVTLRYALEQSLNMPALYVTDRVGVRAVQKTADLFHLADKIPAVPALSLGALDTSLLRLTSAYAALANSGVWVAPRLYLTAVDQDGARVATSQIVEQRAADDGPVFILTNILQGVVERGTARGVRQLGITRAIAGKTGTSDSSRDSWFVAFTPTIAIGVWVGFDDNSPTGLTGGSGAVPIWAKFFQCAQSAIPDVGFVAPRNVVFQEIDGESGELVTPDCPAESRISEVFLRGTEPSLPCSLHSGGGHSHRPYRRDDGDMESAYPEDGNSDGRRRDRGFWSSLFGN